MAIHAINLIPAARIERRIARLHRARCIAGCTIYGIICVAGGITARVMGRVPDPHVGAWLDDASANIERQDRKIAAEHAELEAAESTLKASSAIAQQPNWSLLLALLANQAGEQITLQSCRVRPAGAAVVSAEVPPRPIAKGAKMSPPAQSEPSMMVSITGLGCSQVSVSQFALRLEHTGLFARVRLMETSRENLNRIEAVAFKIDCSLDDPDLSPTAVAPATGSTGQRARTLPSAQAATDEGRVIP